MSKERMFCNWIQTCYLLLYKDIFLWLLWWQKCGKQCVALIPICISLLYNKCYLFLHTYMHTNLILCDMHAQMPCICLHWTAIFLYCFCCRWMIRFHWWSLCFLITIALLFQCFAYFLIFSVFRYWIIRYSIIECLLNKL